MRLPENMKKKLNTDQPLFDNCKNLFPQNTKVHCSAKLNLCKNFVPCGVQLSMLGTKNLACYMYTPPC